VRLQHVHASIHPLIRELSGPRPLCWVADIGFEPYIWNRKPGAISFDTRSTSEITVPRKDHNPTPFKLTKSQCRLYASTLDFTDLHYAEGGGY